MKLTLDVKVDRKAPWMNLGIEGYLSERLWMYLTFVWRNPYYAAQVRPVNEPP